MRYVLSLDGGGVRCYFALRILAALEERTGKPVFDTFDTFNGVSAGSLIISLILLTGSDGRPIYQVREILDIFERESTRIFQWTYLGRLRTGFGLWGPKYNGVGLERVLSEYFENRTLSELPKPVGFLTFDLLSQEINLLRNYSEKMKTIRIQDAIRASTAAPIYFAPFSLRIGEEPRLFVDGGVITNNPSEIAYLEAKHYYPEEECGVLSIGTGREKGSSETIGKHSFGILTWSGTLLDTLFTANSREQEWALRNTNQNGETPLISRLDPEYTGEISLDDCSAFSRMKERMNQWIQENSTELDRISNLLVN